MKAALERLKNTPKTVKVRICERDGWHYLIKRGGAGWIVLGRYKTREKALMELEKELVETYWTNNSRA